MMFREALNEKAAGVAAAIGAERNAHAGVGELFEIDFVYGKSSLQFSNIWQFGLLRNLRREPAGLISAQAF